MKKYAIYFLILLFVISLAGWQKSGDSIMVSESPVTEFDWGIQMEAVDVTSSGLTMQCTQSGGEPSGELQTGSYYVIEKFEKEEWIPVDYIPGLDNIGWEDVAWMIPKNETVEWEVNWEWLYGELPEGQYRIGKEIMDFRESGDYDQVIDYAEFKIGG